MTEEEFYIWLLKYKKKDEEEMHFREIHCDVPEFNLDFLKNYEITKLLLEKFEIHNLSEIQQRNLNLEAFSAWLRVSKYISLQYDIPEISELLPERIRGHLSLWNSKIKSLPELESVGGWLNLRDSQIQTLPELESVGWNLSLQKSQIQTLPHLESVGGNLYLFNSQIQSLPELQSVSEFIYVEEHRYNYWKKYFNETGRQNLAGKVRP